MSTYFFAFRFISACQLKVEAVRLSNQAGRSISEMAKNLDIWEGLLRKWREHFAANGESAFPGFGQSSELD